MFSFKMVHFDAFWSTFRPNNCDYDVHDISRARSNSDHENHSLRNEDYFSTKIVCININYWSFRIKVDPAIFV